MRSSVVSIVAVEHKVKQTLSQMGSRIIVTSENNGIVVHQVLTIAVAISTAS